MSFDALTPGWDLGTPFQEYHEEYTAGGFFEQDFNEQDFNEQSFFEQDFQEDSFQELDFPGDLFPITTPSQEACSSASPRVQSHSRNTSQGSVGTYYPNDIDPTQFTNIQVRTPRKSPNRQLGPLLLPKIRSQDQVVEPLSQPAKRKAPSESYCLPKEFHAKSMMTEIHNWGGMLTTPPQTLKRSAFSEMDTSVKRARTGLLANPWTSQNSRGRPSHHRSHSNMETMLPYSTMTPTPPHSRSSSVSSSPESIMIRPGHQRHDSAPDVSHSTDLDVQSLYRFGFPYRNIPTYVPKTRDSSPLTQEVSFGTHVQDKGALAAGPMTTLTTYLTATNPAMSLVSHVNEQIRDPLAKHFWWDIRQIRAWTSFDSHTISSIPDLASLLSVPVMCSDLPTPPAPRTTRPSSEAELHNIQSAYYATKLNAALSKALGSDQFVMSTSQRADQPSFRSIYTNDPDATSLGRSRVVGLVKANEVWNNTMRAQGNIEKVQYLRGLADLHRHMRAHSCRYGFIMTETELTVVRNGERDEPHFGYLEVRTIDLKEHASSIGDDGEDAECDDQGVPLRPELHMTALLALFYLHMLARKDPLPGQPAAYSEIGAPAVGSRRSCLPRDAWIPQPQLAEKRAAKRARGWVWPEEPVGRKELGKRGVNYGGMFSEGMRSK